MNRSIATFSLAAFAVGLSEFIVIGLIGYMMFSFDVSLSKMGLAVSLYALGISFGAPLLTYLTRNNNGKSLCYWLLIFFAMLSISISITSSFTLLLVLRVFSGVIHGTFFSIASSSVPGLVHETQSCTAIALMFSGLTVAMVLGVPVGMYIAENSSWAVPFAIIGMMALTSAIFMKHLVPETFGLVLNTEKYLGFGKCSKMLVGLYIITFFGFGGGFYFYSYAEPWLGQIGHLSSTQVGFALGLVGVGALLGNVIGGVLPAKTGLRNSLLAMLAIQFVGLTSLELFDGYLPVFVFLFLWSIGAFAVAPIVQTAAVTMSSGGSPRLAASLNITAFNLGISSASYLSTLHVSWSGLNSLPVCSALVVFIAIPVTAFFFRIGKGGESAGNVINSSENQSY
ncbi:MFS transporter [Vibrio cholerae]